MVYKFVLLKAVISFPTVPSGSYSTPFSCPSAASDLLSVYITEPVPQLAHLPWKLEASCSSEQSVSAYTDTPHNNLEHGSIGRGYSYAASRIIPVPVMENHYHNNTNKCILKMRRIILYLPWKSKCVTVS
jgi:hypothetical protein